MPITIFETKGIAVTRRERIEAAVESAGKHLSGPYEGFISSRIKVLLHALVALGNRGQGPRRDRVKACHN